MTEWVLPPTEYDIVAFYFGIKYNILRQLRENGFRVTVVPAHTTAEEVDVYKRQALERGATHYTHWFQPMTGSTAEKHDSFLDPKGMEPIMSLSLIHI